MKSILNLFILAILGVFILPAVTANAQIVTPAPYCVLDLHQAAAGTPHGTATAGDGITNVTLGTLNNSTNGYIPDSTYNYYNTVAAPSLIVGNSYTISITFGACLNAEPMYYAAWIDFNGDNVFSAAELIINNANSGGTEIPYGVLTTRTKTFTVPATAIAGTWRMRVVRTGQMSTGSMTYSSTYTPSVCFSAAENAAGTIQFGEVEDYNVNITAGTATTCAPVTGTTVTGITSVAATISWTAVTGSAGYEYVVNTTATAPLVAGTATALTTANATALTPSTNYYAHVRNNCGGGNYSVWVNIPFSTQAASAVCDTVTGVNITNITSSSAKVNWATASGATGYEYTVNTLVASPSVAGTATTLTNTTVTGLTPATTYYAHIRKKCGTTTYSSWISKKFTTNNTVAVENIMENDSFKLNIYPNPVDDVITITTEGNVGQQQEITIIDMTGRIVRKYNNISEININGVPSGVYFLHYTDYKHVETVRLEKR